MATLRRSIAVSVLFTVFGGPGIGLVFLPLWITHFRIPHGEPLWQTLVAAALIFAGLTPLLDSIRRFIYVGRGTLAPGVPTERLVVSGLYRYVRNPMYVGVLVAMGGEALLFQSRSMVLYAAVVWMGFHLLICFYEEPTLVRRHGAEYLRYAAQVPRWWPRRTPWRDSEEQNATAE